MTNRRLGGQHSAQLLLYSYDFAEIQRLQHEGKWNELAALLKRSCHGLIAAGADLILICSNTMHKVAPEIMADVSKPIVHIAEVIGREIIKKSLKKVGLLGTAVTMEQDFYSSILRDKFDIEVIIPPPDDRNAIHKIIYDELCLGNITLESKQIFKQIVEDLRCAGAEGVILGCTEIPLLVQPQDVSLPLFDTTLLHAAAAVEMALR